jgi:hypothetical protein
MNKRWTEEDLKKLKPGMVNAVQFSGPTQENRTNHPQTIVDQSKCAVQNKIHIREHLILESLKGDTLESTFYDRFC